MRTRALAQAFVNKDAADEALKAYKEVQMPYITRIQKDDKSQHIKRLIAEVSRGPLSITPVMQKQVRSKLKTRQVQRTEEEERASSRRLSKKIGGYL